MENLFSDCIRQDFQRCLLLLYVRSRYGSRDSVDDTCCLRRDLYIDFCMNIYDMNTSVKRDLASKIPDINIRQYEDGHISTMSVLKSFGVSGQWCITGVPLNLCKAFAPLSNCWSS